MQFVTSLVCSVVLVVAELEVEKPVITIPLDQIWALNMPGTRDIRKLDWKPIGNRPLSIGSLHVLKRIGKKKSELGFVVPGTGQDALIAAHKKLPDGEKPSSTLPFGTDVSVVYFSNAFAPHIVLDRVEQRGSVVEIRYRFDATGTDSLSAHIALIPLGKLPVGEYQVTMRETPTVLTQQLSASTRSAIPLVVCQPFAFTIQNRKEKPK